jgi:hypothetical protein
MPCLFPTAANTRRGILSAIRFIVLRYLLVNVGVEFEDVIAVMDPVFWTR